MPRWRTGPLRAAFCKNRPKSTSLGPFFATPFDLAESLAYGPKFNVDSENQLEILKFPRKSHLTGQKPFFSSVFRFSPITRFVGVVDQKL